MSLDTPIDVLHNSLAHACYEGFPLITYQDRDWSSSDRDARVTKTRKHSVHDVSIIAMFPQTWSTTALGFGGLGGNAITTAYTTILQSNWGEGCCVYFSGRFAYRVARPNHLFYEHVANHCLAMVKDAAQYEIAHL